MGTLLSELSFQLHSQPQSQPQSQPHSREPMQSTRITIEKDHMHFSCAHFTIFSANHRENLHGHNYHLKCELDASVGSDGLCFDYNQIKKALVQLCESLDEFTLLPENSPFLSIEHNAGGDPKKIIANFGEESIPFLTRDIKCLPVSNITIEELSRWLLDELIETVSLARLPIQALSLGVSSGEGQWAISSWIYGDKVQGP